MFREMRRNKQQLSFEECEEILKKSTAGVLAVSGDDGYPYAVPLSYVYCDNKIYFHSAKSGHKIDGIKNNSKVSFCVIAKDEIIPEKFTTYFRSVIVFGKARILESMDEILPAIRKLGMKYNPDEEGCNEEIKRCLQALAVIEMDIEHMIGKEAIELTKRRK